MFLWLKLLTVPDSGALRAQFKQEKVVVVPGAPHAVVCARLLGCFGTDVNSNLIKARHGALS